MTKKICSIILVIFIMLATGCFKNNLVTDASGNEKYDFDLNEVVIYNDVTYNVGNVEYISVDGNDDMHNVVVTVNIKNNSSAEIEYNILDWVLLNSLEEESFSVFSSIDSETTLGSGKLSAGEYVTGTILFVQSINEKDLKLAFLNDSFFSNGYLFEINLK